MNDLLLPDAAKWGMIRNEIEEWGYGHYEGLTIDKIKELRRTRGLDKDEEWNIWSDGCEGGEYVLPGKLIDAFAHTLFLGRKNK